MQLSQDTFCFRLLAVCSTTCLHLCNKESGTGTRAGRPYKRNQLPVADDVNSPSQRTGERCSKERWQNERRQRNRSRSRQAGEKRQSSVGGWTAPSARTDKTNLKKRKKNPLPGRILGHGPGVTCRSRLYFQLLGEDTLSLTAAKR